MNATINILLQNVKRQQMYEIPQDENMATPILIEAAN